jgi:hypothetical protein
MGRTIQKLHRRKWRLTGVAGNSLIRWFIGSAFKQGI